MNAHALQLFFHKSVFPSEVFARMPVPKMVKNGLNSSFVIWGAILGLASAFGLLAVSAFLELWRVKLKAAV